MGLSGFDDEVIAASIPRPPLGTIPMNRVANAAPGEVPERASARSSTPDPQRKAAGSMSPVVGVHAAPPGTRTSAPAAHVRPTVPTAPDAPYAAASHVGCACPFASRK
jgi:hypothetical protein